MKPAPLYDCSRGEFTTTESGRPAEFDPWEPVVGPLLEALSGALSANGAPIDVAQLRLQLDRTGSDRGDLALALHRPAKELGTDPAAFARTIAGAVGPVAGVRSVAATGAFVNIVVDAAGLTERTLRIVLDRGDRWGHLEGRPLAACVEHTSANPTGPFHVGRVRNGIIGDTLARVLRATGADVTTQYYVDDVGRQAAMLTWIWSQPRDSWPPEVAATVGETPPGGEAAMRPDARFGRPYPAVSRYLKSHPEAADEVAAISRRLESGEELPEHRQLAQAVLSGMVASLARIGITFDEFVWESTFLRDGSVERVVERLRKAPHAVRESNGAWALDTAGYGLPKESSHVIVTRADGTSLYAVRDVAYHAAKFDRFPRVIDVLGQDHHLHAKTLDAMLAEAGIDRRPEFVIYQDITVPEGGRMSTRQGRVVYLDDLLDEAIERARAEVLKRHDDLGPSEVDAIARTVAAAAVRYHIVRVAPEKTVQFRWEDALAFEGRSGPFLLYSYARASSILRKAGVEGPFEFKATELGTEPELALVKAIARFPAVVENVARTTHVHALAGYAHDVAEEFNRFYESTPVLTAGSERASRIALVAAARQTLGNAMRLLGLEPLERM